MRKHFTGIFILFIAASLLLSGCGQEEEAVSLIDGDRYVNSLSGEVDLTTFDGAVIFFWGTLEYTDLADKSPEDTGSSGIEHFRFSLVIPSEMQDEEAWSVWGNETYSSGNASVMISAIKELGYPDDKVILMPVQPAVSSIIYSFTEADCNTVVAGFDGRFKIVPKYTFSGESHYIF